MNKVMSLLSVAAAKLDGDIKKFLFRLLEIKSVTALGTTQATAVSLTAGKNVVLAADGTVGVALPKAKKGMQVAIVNTVSNQALKVYAATGEVVNAIGTTAAFSLGGGGRAVFECDVDAHWYVAAANLTGTSTSSSTAELDYLDITTLGTGAASKAIVLDASGDYTYPATATIVMPSGGTETFQSGSTLAVAGTFTNAGNTMTTGAGAGFTDGSGAIYKNSVTVTGGIKKLSILLDLTGTASSTTDLDIIGSGVSQASIGRILAAEVGTVLTVQMTCLEAPAGGVTDIDLYSATAATGAFDSLVTDLTETALITSAGAWTNGRSVGATVVPPANDYLYLTGGAAGTAATYTAGKFLIEVTGY